MKQSLAFILAIVFGLQLAAQPDTTGYARNRISDLALIYQGGSHRIPWTVDEIEPYVVHSFADGSRQWLFDGFLFIEFADLPECNFAPGYAGKRDARKDDWQRYLDSMFAPGRALCALDSCIERNIATLGTPPFRHKVVVTLPTPILHQKDWGEVDGRALDFDCADDALAACRWWVDTLCQRFNDAGFKHISLDGFYWVDEDMKRRDGITRRIAPYIHERGLQFVWIPYYTAPGHERWRELGFDIAYHQPNHFFAADIPDSRLDEACAIARSHGMAMEFECDERALDPAPEGEAQPAENFQARMTAYIDAFERNGVFAHSALAYYTGNHLLLDFHRAPSAANRALADRLARHITRTAGFRNHPGSQPAVGAQ